MQSSIRREVFPAGRPIHTKERNDASTYVDPAGDIRIGIHVTGAYGSNVRTGSDVSLIHVLEGDVDN